MGISYYGSSKDFILRGYFDAIYVGNHDDQKSFTGYLFLLANGVVAWCCKRQGCIINSTIEIEFVALVEMVKEAIWLYRLLHNLGIPPHMPTIVFSNNQGAIQLVKNSKYHTVNYEHDHVFFWNFVHKDL